MNQAQTRTAVFITALLVVFLVGFLPNSFFYVLLKIILLGVGAGTIHHLFPDLFPLFESLNQGKTIEKMPDVEDKQQLAEQHKPATVSASISPGSEKDVEQHFEAFLNTIFPLIRQTIVANTAVLLLVNYSRKTFFLRHFDSDVDDMIQPQASFDVNQGLPAILLKHRKPILENQLPQNETLLPYYATEDSAARAFMGVPIVFSDAVIGLLCVDSRIEKAFSEEDLMLLQNFGQILGLHLESSNRLFEYEAERKQQESFDRFRNIAKKSAQPHEFWKNCAEFLAKEINADRVLVADRTAPDTARLIYSSGMEPPLAVQTVFSDREGILGWVLRNHQLMQVNDFLEKENYVPRCSKEETTEGVLGALMAVPVKQDDQVVAVLSVESQRSAAFSDDTRTLLNRIAAEAEDFLMRPATAKNTIPKKSTPVIFEADALRSQLSTEIKASEVFTLQLIGLDQSRTRNFSLPEQQELGEEFSIWLKAQLDNQATAWRIGQWRWAIAWPNTGIAENFAAVQQMLMSLEQNDEWLSGKLDKIEAFIGLTQYPEGGKTVAALLGGAEKSLLKAQLGEAGAIEIAIPEELLQNGTADDPSESV